MSILTIIAIIVAISVLFVTASIGHGRMSLTDIDAKIKSYSPMQLKVLWFTIAIAMGVLIDAASSTL